MFSVLPPHIGGIGKEKLRKMIPGEVKLDLYGYALCKFRPLDSVSPSHPKSCVIFKP